MIVTCEKCHTNFQIDEIERQKINKDGRILKCGNCHHMWLVTKPVSVLSGGFSITHDANDPKLLEELRHPHQATMTLVNVIAEEPIADYFKFTSQPLFKAISI